MLLYLPTKVARELRYEKRRQELSKQAAEIQKLQAEHEEMAAGMDHKHKCLTQALERFALQVAPDPAQETAGQKVAAAMQATLQGHVVQDEFNKSLQHSCKTPEPWTSQIQYSIPNG